MVTVKAPDIRGYGQPDLLLYLEQSQFNSMFCLFYIYYVYTMGRCTPSVSIRGAIVSKIRSEENID